jgi:hypothetical protein
MNKDFNVPEKETKRIKERINGYLDFVLKEEISASERFRKIRLEKQKNEDARLKEETARSELQDLVSKGNRLEWTDPRLFEIWAEQNVSGEFRGIFKLENPEVLFRTLISKINSAPAGSFRNADVLFLFKKLAEQKNTSENKATPATKSAPVASPKKASVVTAKSEDEDIL